MGSSCFYDGVRRICQCAMRWYSTLFFLGGVYRHSNSTCGILWYSTLLFLGGVYPAQVFSSPKVLVVASDTTTQLTEYSCFRDDHASPQALIPVIPSVLVFFGGESGIRTHGCFRIAGFQDRCLQPLGHLSVFPAAGSAYGGVIVFTRLRPQ